MLKYEVKLLGRDGNIYYLPVTAQSRSSAKSEVYREYEFLNFEVIDVHPITKNKNFTTNNTKYRQSFEQAV